MSLYEILFVVLGAGVAVGIFAVGARQRRREGTSPQPSDEGSRG